MTYVVRYIVNGRWALGGRFTNKQRCVAFCEWLTADGIPFTLEIAREIAIQET